MRTVAVETVFSNVGMFIKEWPSFLSMALNTGFFNAVLRKILTSSPPMGIVAVNAENSPLSNGMMARQGKLGLGRLMTAETELARSNGGYLQVRSGVNIMAVKTGDLVDGMNSGIPVVQVESSIGSVTLETDE
jgi:hypothetical protein